MVGSLENIDNNQKGGMNMSPPQGLAAANRESRLTPLSIAGGVGAVAAGALFGAEVGAAALVAAPVALANNRYQASQQAASELRNLTDLKSFLDPLDGVPPELLGYELWDKDEGAVSDAVHIPFLSQIFYKDKGTKTAIVIMGEQNKVRFSLNASAKVDAYEGLDTRNDTKYFGEIAELKESDSVEGYLAVVPAEGAEHFTNEGGRIYLYLTKITAGRPIDAPAVATLTELIKSKVILRIKIKEAGGMSHTFMRGKVGTSRFKVDKGLLLGHVAKIMAGYDKGYEVNLNAAAPPRPEGGRDRPPRRRGHPPAQRRGHPPARQPIPARRPPAQLDLTVRATQGLAPRVRFDDDVVVRRPSGGGRRSSGKRKNKTRKRRKNSSRRKRKSSKRKKRTTRGK